MLQDIQKKRKINKKKHAYVAEPTDRAELSVLSNVADIAEFSRMLRMLLRLYFFNFIKMLQILQFVADVAEFFIRKKGVTKCGKVFKECRE